MRKHSALIQKNIVRASYSLSFIDPDIRELIGLIPSLFAEGRPSLGIYEHPTCTQREYELLKKYLLKKPDIIVGRLPYRVMIESLIVLISPSISGDCSLRITIVCIARQDASEIEIRAKLDMISEIFRRVGIPFTGLVYRDALPQLLVYDIMRTGIVLAGKEPVMNIDSASESCVFIGELPRRIQSPEKPVCREWNPFRHYLDTEAASFIARDDYPSALTIPSANPFIVPYLHILHHHEETGDSEAIEKVRTCLFYEFSSFPPTKEVMKNLKAAWKMTALSPAPAKLGFPDALRLRKWLVPVEEHELPIFSWPPPRNFSVDRVELKREADCWCIQGCNEFTHVYPWVVLAWAAVSGLIGSRTRIATPQSLLTKRNCTNLILDAMAALSSGTDLLVPEDHRQGSVSLKDGRPFFSARPFAILEQGRKHSLEIFEVIKKKTLIDDTDLKDKSK